MFYIQFDESKLNKSIFLEKKIQPKSKFKIKSNPIQFKIKIKIQNPLKRLNILITYVELVIFVRLSISKKDVIL
jgi:hypothetical protein